MTTEPNMRLLLSANREGNWSDLLGAMIETDPLPIQRVLGLQGFSRIHVSRERTAAWVEANGKRRNDRADLVLTEATGGQILAVIEVKVLAPVGEDQLERYANSISAEKYGLLQLRKFEVSPTDADWESLTWEEVLDAYSHSQNVWVAGTARAWRT